MKKTVTSAVSWSLFLAVLAGTVAFGIAADAQVTSLPVNKCLASKVEGVGKYVAAITKCAAKAASTAGSIDPPCTGKAAGNLANGQILGETCGSARRETVEGRDRKGRKA